MDSKKPPTSRLSGLYMMRFGKQQVTSRTRQRIPWKGLAVLALLIGTFVLWTEKESLKWSAAPAKPIPIHPTEEVPPSAPTASPSPASVPAPEHPVQAGEAASYAQWKGFYCGFKNFREVVIRNATEWQDLWKTLGQYGAAPTVDFDASMVVGIFLGERPGGYDVILLKPKETERGATIRYQVMEPRAGVNSHGPMTQPFHLKVIPRSDSPVHFRRVMEE